MTNLSLKIKIKGKQEDFSLTKITDTNLPRTELGSKLLSKNENKTKTSN
jgi:hypothetical protein